LPYGSANWSVPNTKSFSLGSSQTAEQSQNLLWTSVPGHWQLTVSLGSTVQGILSYASSLSVTRPSPTRSTADVGQSVSFSVVASNGSVGPYRYLWTGLPTGCVTANAALLSCTPTGAGLSAVAVTVTDANGSTVTSESLSYRVFLDPVASAPVASPTSADVGQSATFSSSVSGGSGGFAYAWSGLPTGCPTASASVTCTMPTAAVLSLSFQATDSNGLSSTSPLLNFTVYPDPTSSVPTANRSSADVGQAVKFTAAPGSGSGGFTFAWTGLPAGCTGAGATIACTVTTASTNSISVTVTDSNGFAATSPTLTFVVFADPAASTPTASRSSVDLGQSVTFGTTASSGSGGYTYAWSGLPTGCSGTMASIVCTPSGAGTVLVRATVTDSNGFSVSSSTLSFTSYADPSVTTPSPSRASADVGQSVTFTASASAGSGGYVYAWSGLPTGCTSSTSTATCTTTASGTLSVTLTVTDSNGGSVTSASVSYTVDADPTVSTPTAGPKSVDVGQLTTLSTTASLGSGGYTYAWSGLPTGCSGTSSTLACTPTGAGAFTVTVTVTDSNGFAVSSAPLSITVYADPTVGTPTTNRSSVDVGQSVNFVATASLGSGGFSYVWTGLPPGCTGAGASIDCSVTASGTYSVSVSVTDSNGFTVVSKTLAYRVFDDPTVGTPIANRSSADAGQAVTFSGTASSGSGGYSYAWSGLPSGCSGAGAVKACSPSAAATLTIVLTVTDSNGFSVVSAALTFTVYAAPTEPAPSASPSSVDVGQTLQLTATPSMGSGGFTFAWTGLPAGCPSAPTTGSLRCLPTTPGDYTITVTATDSNGASATASRSFTVFADPSAGLPSANRTSADVGQSVTFTASVSGGSGGFVYAWSGLPFGCGSSGATIRCVVTAPGLYQLKVSVNDSNGVANTSRSIAFEVFALPSAQALGASNPSVDVGQSYTWAAAITANGSGGLVFAWSQVPSALSCGPLNGATITCRAAAAGRYDVTLTVTDSNGGASSTTSVVLLVVADPTVGAPKLSQAAIDANSSVSLSANASGGSGGLTFAWSGLPAGCSAVGPSVTCRPGTAGSFRVTVTVTDSNGFSVTSGPSLLTVNPALSATFPAVDPSNLPRAGTPYGLSAEVTGGTGPFDYAWQFGDGLLGNGPSPQHAYGSAGTYTVVLVINDSGGGSVRITERITVEAAPSSAGTTGSLGGSSWALVAGIAVVALALLALGLLRRRRSKGPTEPSDEPGPIEGASLGGPARPSTSEPLVGWSGPVGSAEGPKNGPEAEPIPRPGVGIPEERIDAPPARRIDSPPKPAPRAAPTPESEALPEGPSGCFVCGTPLDGDYCPKCRVHWRD
ncbi:MAG TPA: PKD domain-containing protein, partial [Thermoplasmata archaeon]|nr:PKD domain-containing protein [Thermoplasmata archaeon]